MLQVRICRSDQGYNRFVLLTDCIDLQEMHAKEHSMIQETVNLTDALDEKLQATLRVASASHAAFEELKEEIAYSRYSTTGISFWRLMEFTGTCKSP